MNQNILPKDFNWKVYVKINKDVINDKNEAIKHYLNHGIYENRVYKIDTSLLPSNFNWRDYLELNPDLHEFTTKIEAQHHYIKNGIKENRLYKKTDLFDDTLSENDVLYTRQFFVINSQFLKYKTNFNIINSLISFVLVVDFNNGGGGTTIFLNKIISKYKKFNNFLIVRFDGKKYTLNLNEEYIIMEEFNKLNKLTNMIDSVKNKCSKIFINHLLGYDKDFIDYIFNLNILKIGISHDFYNIFNDPQPTFDNFENSIKNDLIDINKYDLLLTQNIEIQKIFSKYFNGRIDVIKMPDFKYSKEKILTSNDCINCCIIGNINELKGSKKLKQIIDYGKSINQNINFFVIGYCDNKLCQNYKTYNSLGEFNYILNEIKPNIIIELTIWPETYSFTLTLSMLTKLPILYLKKPYNSVVKNRLMSYDKAFEFETKEELFNLILNKFQNYFYTIEPVISFDKYWNNLFVNKPYKITENIKTKFRHNIKPYFIYFPQFHEIYENNVNFYYGYNDVKNLKFFNNNNLIKNEIPSTEFIDIDDYDCNLNDKLIQKQIDLTVDYGFNGFAIYYYWFSLNEYTDQHMIMKSVIDKFFDSKTNLHDKKVFFIWANENWTNNKAFHLTGGKKIINNYDDESFKNNSKNLIKYFKNDNYLKIDNKPVFFIYHTYLIDDIDAFYKILNELCILNGFDGVHLVLNSFDKEYPNYKNFYINFNYKVYDSRFFDEKDQQIKLDYRKYMNDRYHFKENKIQTIVYDFDNRARLCNPDQLKNSTICINNTELSKIVFTKKIIDTYKNVDKKSELDTILLVNSLNEWGENMAFEPSDKYGYYNINLLHSLL